MILFLHRVDIHQNFVVNNELPSSSVSMILTRVEEKQRSRVTTHHNSSPLRLSLPVELETSPLQQPLLPPLSGGGGDSQGYSSRSKSSFWSVFLDRV
ncbi:hypothetical protein P8452_62803 [Trifolium repens]|nr:hypothetical protein P8452_62803 [Trifolium repens]